MLLANKVAIVTGAGSGIGQASALRLASEGARVVLAGRRAGKLAETEKLITDHGGQALVVPCNVAVVHEDEKLVAGCLEQWGRLDVLVNAAGTFLVANALGTSESEYDWVMDVNVKGVFFLSRAAVPAMKKSGGCSIVNISSALGLVGAKNRAVYCASKAAVAGLTRALAMDHAADGIRVNGICPGFVLTDMTRPMIEQDPDPEKARQLRVKLHPLGRLGTPKILRPQ